MEQLAADSAEVAPGGLLAAVVVSTAVAEVSTAAAEAMAAVGTGN